MIFSVQKDSLTPGMPYFSGIAPRFSPGRPSKTNLIGPFAAHKNSRGCRCWT
jgi:hypothetical protein